MTEQHVDIESIFDRAVEINSSEQQRAYLDEACGRDPDLRARVEALLRANNDAGSFLAKPPEGLVATIATGEFETVKEGLGEVSLDFLAPSQKANCLGTLGQHEVVEVVGRGGMGVVLRAYDTKLNRVVAIKVMAPELAANPMAVKRFLREARAAAAVSHDHVVTIHAIEEDNRPPYIVMEFIDGHSLQEKVDRDGALELKEILRIGMQMARGLAAAHEQGLVHRDIKPANILLENGVERVKLTDFGLARAVDDVSVTQTGQIAGTPQFMSPEQAQGHAIDARSDLFSLGSVLYTMCTGRPPFRADTAVAMLRRVTDDDPRSIHELYSDIPAWLEAITFKLLAKEPAERFQSAEEVAELLSQYLAHLQHPTTAPKPQPVLPPVRQPSEQPAKPVMRKAGYHPAARRVWALIAIAVAAMAVGVAALGTIIYFVTDYGTLVIESEDQNAEITIGKVRSDTEKGFEFRVVDKVTGSEAVRLRSGHYRILAFDPNNSPDELEFKVSKEQFVLKRGGKVVVRVTRRSSNVSPERGPPMTESEITEVLRFEGHTDFIDGVAFSADGSLLLTGSNDKTVRLWNAATSEELITLNADELINSVAVSPSGHIAAAGLGPGRIVLWDLADGSQLRRISGHAEGSRGMARVMSLEFSPDGKRLLSGGDDGSARIWDVENGEQLQSFDGTGSPVQTVTWSFDGSKILAAEYAGVFSLWDMKSGKLLQRNGEARDKHAAFAPDGRRIVSGLKVFDSTSMEVVTQLQTDQFIELTAIQFTIDGRFVVAGVRDASLRVWDVMTGREVARVDNDHRVAQKLDVSPDGRHVASGGGVRWDNDAETLVRDGDYALRLWRLPESVWPQTAKDDNTASDHTDID